MNKRSPCCEPNAPITFCVVCGNLVHTCERAEPIEEDGCSDYICPAQGHGEGVELSGGRGWVCSRECGLEAEVTRLEGLIERLRNALKPFVNQKFNYGSLVAAKDVLDHGY